MRTTVTEARSAGRLTRRDLAPTLVTVLALLAWSTYAYLTVRVDSDILAEAMQVQRWLDDPFWVLSYPGQLYGGVLEYPLIMVAETVAPGSPYGFTLLRIAYLPLIGLMACINVRRLDASWSLWPVAIAAAAGPAVLHGFMPIKDLYPFGWVVAMLGVTLAYWQLASARTPLILAAGTVLVGLGIYQHPTTVLFSLPLIVAGLVHWRAPARQVLWALAGLVVGLIPFALALVAQPDALIVYESARLGVPQLLPALGLSTASDAFAYAVTPNAWGVQFTDINLLAFPAGLQLALNATIAAGLVLSLVLAVPVVVSYARGRELPRHAFLVTLWATFLVVLVVLVTFVRPVFFYGAGVAFLVWITLGALPSVLSRTPRLIVTGAVVTVMAVTSIGSVLAVEPLLPRSISFKYRQVQQVAEYARAIEAAGIPFVYGTYWEALPIAHAAGGAIHPLTSSTSRFRAPAVEGDRILVAVPDGMTVLPIGLPRWPGSAEAVAYAEGTCTALPDVTATLPAGISAYSCPVSFIASATGAPTD